MKSTKIVCTIGPKSHDENVITEMVEAGMDIVRMNLSHGSYDFHSKTIERTRKISRMVGKYIGILLDLQGPKIRTGKMKKEQVVLNRGEVITLTTEDILGDWKILSVNYKRLPNEARIGEKILLDDGNIELEVVGVEKKSITCKVIDGGIIRSYRGINLPDTKIMAPPLTKKDLQDLDFGLGEGVDYVALSFVQKPEDVLDLRAKITKKTGYIPIIAKIEKPDAVKNIDDLIRVSDGIMVARGDLGAETSPQDIPILQKMIIKKCNLQGKPVITATQMLESMINHPRPTRAEATDVANAIFDGTDAVMLSGETAVGEYPVRAVRVMADIAKRAEAEMNKDECNKLDYAHSMQQGEVPDSLSYYACKITDVVRPKFIVAFTLSGKTASLISKYRPSVPIIAMSPDEEVLRRLSLFWGVYGVRIDMVTSTEELIDRSERIMIDRKLCKEGDTVLMVGGVPVLSGIAANMIKVHRIKIGDINI